MSRPEALEARIQMLLATAAKTEWPEEADTALKLAEALQTELVSLEQTEVKQTQEQETNYYTPDIHRDMRWSDFWGFGSWRRYADSMHSAHSGDPVNRDFNTWIGRRCAQEPEFKNFWTEISKSERKLWKETHWRPPNLLPGDAPVNIFKHGRWFTREGA